MSNLKANYIYQLIYRVLTVITPLVTSPYLARSLGVESQGVFSATYATANFFLLFAMLGVESYGNRTIAILENEEEQQSSMFWSIYCVQFIAAVIATVGYYLFILLTVSTERKIVALAQGIWVISAGLDINWYFFGRQRFKITVTRNILIKIISIILIFVFVHTERDLIAYTLIMAGSTAISQIVMWIIVLPEVRTPKIVWKHVRNHIKPMLLLFIPVLAFSLFHIMDKMMVDILSDDVNSGCYYNVDRLMNIPLTVITGLSTVMLPRISKMVYSENVIGAEKLIKKSLEITMFISSALAFGLGSIAREFVPFFFGDGFELCIPMIHAFVPIVIIKALSDLIRQQYLIPANNNKLYIIAVCCGAAVNLIVNCYLIKKYDALGAVFGTLIAEIIVLLIEVIGCKDDIGFAKLIKENSFYIIAAGIMFIGVRMITLLFKTGSVLCIASMILGGAVIYGVIVLAYWKINSKSFFYKKLERVNSK